MSLTAAASTMFLMTNFRIACRRNNSYRRLILDSENTHLVLGDTLGAVGAADILDVAPAVLVASVVPPLGRHLLQTRVIIIKGRQRHTINLSPNTARQFHII